MSLVQVLQQPFARFFENIAEAQFFELSFKNRRQKVQKGSFPMNSSTSQRKRLKQNFRFKNPSKHSKKLQILEMEYQD